MSRPVWVGSLSFGPVTLPVRVHGAVVSRQVQFHLRHDADGARIQNKRVCSADGEEVPLEHVVRGYTLADGRQVTVTSGELEALDPMASQVIALEEFVDPARVDSLLVDTSFHLMPAKGAEHAHALLAAALRESGRVGVGRWVLYQKGHLCLVRPHARGLVLSTLHAVDEVVSREQLSEQGMAEAAVEPGELEATLRLIEARSADFEPGRYPDVHRERVLAFLERRARAQARTRRGPRPAPEVTPREAETGALLGVLERGVAALRAGQPLPSVEGALRLRPRVAAREVRERGGDTPTPERESTPDGVDDEGGEPAP
ncbi:Ku protein [Myxococcus sp. CA056]|uniref:non-homologous end joining protein Ku n=1 Tax=Myxococcus sp. CA056 TaxID=2741740 RepID=UPI00157B6179|nr:Ku protein [Myxococcus sp. CA056]NTX15881.1 Ku protein [Myxococcus sp. CA056]